MYSRPHLHLIAYAHMYSWALVHSVEVHVPKLMSSVTLMVRQWLRTGNTSSSTFAKLTATPLPIHFHTQVTVPTHLAPSQTRLDKNVPEMSMTITHYLLRYHTHHRAVYGRKCFLYANK